MADFLVLAEETFNIEMNNNLKISGLYHESIPSNRNEDFEWIPFGGSKSVSYGVVDSVSGGMYFSFPSREWTLDMSINIGEKPTYRVFGIRSGTSLLDCQIPERGEKDGLYIVSMSVYIGNGITIKDSFKLRSLSGLDFWFMRKA